MAARFCSQCGREVSATAQYCAGCGAPLDAVPGLSSARTQTLPPSQPVTGVVAATNTTRRLLLPIAIAAIVVLAIAVAVLAHKLSEPSLLTAPQATVPPAPSLLTAPSAPPPAAPPLTNAPSQPVTPGPALTNAPTKPGPSLPPDVAAYLKFLQGIEERRVALDNDVNGAAAMLGAAQQMQAGQDQEDPEAHNQGVNNGVGQVNQGYADYTAKWNALIRDFRAVNPPPPCAMLANAYLAFLTDYVATISKLQVALLNHDLSAAMGAQGAQKQIDTEAIQADTALGQICDHYGVPKPFAIQSGDTSTPLVGL